MARTARRRPTPSLLAKPIIPACRRHLSRASLALLDRGFGRSPHRRRSKARAVSRPALPAPGRGEDAHPAAAGTAVEVVLGHRAGGHRGGRGGGAARRRPDSAPPSQSRRLHQPRARPGHAVPAVAGPRRRVHRRPRPDVSFRRARAPRHRDDQPPGGDAAGGRRHGAGLSAQGRIARGRGVQRRRRDLGRRLPRGGEPGGGVEAARALRHREQPIRPVHARERAVRVRAIVGPRRRLRHGRRDRGRQRPGRRRRGRRAGSRPGPRRRGTDAAGVHDLPDARPRRGVGRGVRAGAPVRGVGRQGSDRAIRAGAARPGRADDGGPRRHPRGVQGAHRSDRRRGLRGAGAGVDGGAGAGGRVRPAPTITTR